MEVAPFFWKKIVNGSAAFRIVAGADVAFRLVHGEVELAFRLYGTAIDGHAVVQGIDLGSKGLHHLAIDDNATFEDDLFARAPRCDPRVREEFLQTHLHISRTIKQMGRPSSRPTR